MANFKDGSKKSFGELVSIGNDALNLYLNILIQKK